MIAEKDTVYDKFPIPLINRLEKHFVLTSTVLIPWQEDVLEKLTDWVDQFCKIDKGRSALSVVKLHCDYSGHNSRFTEGDSFIGYQKDMPASVVFQVTNQLREEQEGEVDEEMEEKDDWKDAVLQFSKDVLVQMATPDAIIRLKCTALAEQQQQIKQTYSNQCHGSIAEFLSHHLDNHKGNWEEGGLLLQVTLFSFPCVPLSFLFTSSGHNPQPLVVLSRAG